MNNLISINMCIYKISELVLIQSIHSIFNQTYNNYELIIIDDGIIDVNILLILELYSRNFPKIKIFKNNRNLGISASRNIFLDNAIGDIITFLDCDNIWNSEYLYNIVEIYVNNPDYTIVYAKLKYLTTNNILFEDFNYDTLLKYNYIDINIFSFRKLLYNKYGGFDIKLNRLVDWDFILKYTKYEKIYKLDYIGCIYNNTYNIDRVTNNQQIISNEYFIKKKYSQNKNILKNFKILYIVYHYCQLSETYIDWEINYFEELGAKVDIYVDIDYVASKISHNKTIITDLSENTLKNYNYVHIHWLSIASKYHMLINKPITIKLHGFEFDINTLKDLINNKNIIFIFIYKHTYDYIIKNYNINTDKLIISKVSFNPKIHYPLCNDNKIPNSILRVGAGLPTKNIEMFIELANEMIDFKFTLCIIKCSYREECIDTFLSMNKKLGDKCTILINVDREEIGNIMRQSTIYLHTTSQIDINYGQPVSIIEAMACGNYIIAQKSLGTSDYIPDYNAIFENKAECKSKILETLKYTEIDWINIRNKNIEYAFLNYSPEVAYSNVVNSILNI